MSDSLLPLNPATLPGGKVEDVEEFNVATPVPVPPAAPGTTNVIRQRLQVVGKSLAEIARVINGAPVGTEYALVVRNIPSGVQPISGALTQAQLETELDEKFGDLGQKTMAGSAPVVIASDQTAVPISAAALPLPAGAATEATLAAILVDTNDIESQQIDGSQKAQVRGGAKGATAAADVTSTAEGADHQALDVQLYTGGVAVSPLTQAQLETELDEKFGDLGQKTMAGSAPVVIASDQTPVPIAGIDENNVAHEIKTDPTGVQMVALSSPVGAFGKPIVAEYTPITQQHFTYGIQPRITATRVSAGASVVGSGQAGNGADAVISIPVTANAFAIAKSFRELHYRAGIGQVSEFTAAFNVGVANSQQFAGLWSPGSGFFVGYNGVTWGCFARLAGTQEIRTLTVTTAATSANNVTVTIDGTAFVIAVTNQTGNPSRTAWEISQTDFSTAGGAGTWGWDAYALGAVIYFIARRARVNGGAFTFAAGATGSAAAFATVRAGVAETDDFGSPAVPGNWMFLDALDGTGPSKLNLNKQKGIIYAISVGHLGHRGARMFVMNPITGLLVLFADYRYMGTSVSTALNNPTVFVAWGIIANGSVTAMTMNAGSGLGALEGKLDEHEGEAWSVTAAKTAQNGSASHYVSVRNGPIAGFGGQTPRAGRISVAVQKISVGLNGGGAGAYVDVQVVRNATFTNLATFAQVDATRLALWAWQDTTSATGAASGGAVLLTMRVPSGQIETVEVDFELETGETLSLIITGNANSEAVDATMSGIEIQ